jgi:hypothetical protein
MKFRKKPVVIDATQWFRNGDHPQDYAKDVEGLLKGEPHVFPAADCKAANWEGQVVRYFRHPEVSSDTACKHCGQTMHVHGWIETLEGGHIVCPGDWIITGVQGEHYPCKPDIFAATYDVVTEEPEPGAPKDYPPRGDFGFALAWLKAGARVARAGWNGKHMFVYLVPAASYSAQTGAAKAFFGENGMVPYNAYLALKGVNDTVSTWAPSGSDALAEDWYMIDEGDPDVPY